MSKKVPKYFLEVFEDSTLVCSQLLPCDKAEDTFIYYCQLAVKIRFPSINRFRIISGSHILFEFRDVRKIVDQKEFLL